jgi:hypothetical protein
MHCGRGVFGSLAGSRPLLRVLAAYGLFILSEYAVWTAMLVFAYRQGGATVAAVVALAQLLPAAAVAPLAAARVRSPAALLAGGYVVQAAGMAATAAAMLAGQALLAYAAAIVASTAVTTTRPAQAAVVPAAAATPDQLTAANVVAGWLEAAGITAAGLVTGGLIAAGGVAVVFAVCAGLGGVAALLVAGIGRAAPAAASAAALPADPGPASPEITGSDLAGPALDGDGGGSGGTDRGTAAGDLAGDAGAGGPGDGLRVGAADRAAPAGGPASAARLAARAPAPRLILALLTAEAVTGGALDLLMVILATRVLGRPAAWAGYLNAAFGAGAVLAATLSTALVGRRLGRPVLIAALTLSAALGALALGPGLAVTVLLLTAAGAGRAVLDVAGRTLLQRSVPSGLTARVFGLLEGLCMAGLAAGGLLVPALMRLGGPAAALAGVAALLPLAVLAGARVATRLDTGSRVPVVEIALLRSLPLFADLPAPALEGLAAGLVLTQLEPGQVLIRQGEPGDAYYAIAAGELDVARDGRLRRRCGRGEGVGEIALLRRVPRTATVTARTAATVYGLRRELFLGVVAGHPATGRQADQIAAARLAADTAPAPAPLAGL